MAQMNHSSWHHKVDVVATAGVFIAIGFLLILRNLGILSYPVYHFLVSWQMLLVLIGVVQLIKHKIVGGAILVTIGGYFLFPHMPWWPGRAVFTFWPAVFIFTGIAILLSRLNNTSSGRSQLFGNKDMKNVSSTVNGFLSSEVAFGSAQHIVFDPYFKGGRVYNSFGNTIVDLRRTELEDPEVTLTIDSSFGGVEIYVPAHWYVQVDVDTALSGFNDKRYQGYEERIDTSHKLVIRGKLSFSGLEIKN